jgi:propane monooxygenase large subunit
MGRFSGRRQWEEVYDGWDVADAIVDMGFVRPDGKTLIAQPHMSFEEKDMWTLDHVRGNTIRAPLKMLREMTPEARLKHIDEYRSGFKVRRI